MACASGSERPVYASGADTDRAHQEARRGWSDRADSANAVAVEPVTLCVRDRLTVTIVLENHSDHEIRGLRVFSAGPWEEYTVDQVIPAGRVDMTWLGATFSTPLTIGPGQSGQFRVTASPRAAGDSHFTFTPNPFGDRHLPRLTGQRIVFDADVKVTP